MKRKKILPVFILSLCFIFNLYGQESLEKGNSMIGGGIGFTIDDNTRETDSSQNYEQSNSSFNFAPYYGKFIKDRLLFGVQATFGTINLDSESAYSTNTSVSETKAISFGGGLFLRKYFPIVDKFGFYFQPGLNYSNSSREFKSYSIVDGVRSEYENYEDEKRHSVSLGANLGLYYFISDKFSIETNLANLAFSKSFSDIEDSNNQNDFSSTSKRKTNHLSLEFINELTFDKIFVINYFF